MRGKLYTNAFLHCWKRITPADAGKTFQNKHFRHTLKDHPRGCGENYNQLYKSAMLEGSPPRMRGKQGEKVK